MATTRADEVPAPTPDNRPRPILVDLGKKKRRLCKKLRDGRGPLMDDVIDSIRELEDDGQIKAGAQPVLVIVTEKRRRRNRMF